MTIAYFDCFSGISGDMALGALLDCGVPLDALRAGLASLPVEGWSIEAQPTLQSGIHALDISITLHGQSDAQELAAFESAQGHHEHGHNHDHSHDHASSHDHDHSHEHSHADHSHATTDNHHHEHEHAHHDHDHPHDEGQHAHPHFHGRSMREIRETIEASALSARVKGDALRVFEKIAEAEAYLHHSTPDDIHFHEIGGLDSLLDICGVAWCLEYLGVDEVRFSPLPLGSGFVNCAHGKMPVPAPATLRLLVGAPTVPTDLKGELVTPTGAGFVAALAVGFDAPALQPRLIGHGAGKKRFPDHPNMLRVMIGDVTDTVTDIVMDTVTTPTPADGLEWRTLELLESNVDDMNPEGWGHVIERTLEAGALDCWIEPIQMKKARPAQKLCALCARETRDDVLKVILRETTTLGVRCQTVERAALPRAIATVTTPYGTARVKRAHWDAGGIERFAPEWDDVARIARETGLPAHQIYREIGDAARAGT